jgi:malate synthase
MANIRAVELVTTTNQSISELVTPHALLFVGELVRAFRPRVERLRAARRANRLRHERVALPDFRPETAHIRSTDWKCLPEPPVLVDRRVDVSGRPDRSTMLAAFAAGATSFTADFEDSISPTWSNVIDGHAAVNDFVHDRRHGPIFLCPRGLHQNERHLLVDEGVSPASLVDVGLHAFHNARTLAGRAEGPFFTLPKLESREEARFWNDVLLTIERAMGVPRGVVKATVVIETVPALFEMHEILWELREHSAGLMRGQSNLLLDFVSRRATDPRALLPDRDEVLAGRSFVASSTALVQCCHRRGVHAIGGRAPLLCTTADRSRNAQTLARLRGMKLREAITGFDGATVLDPAFVPAAREVYDAVVEGEHQLDELREDVFIRRQELLTIAHGARTERGVRDEIRTCLHYLDAWLEGRGTISIGHQREIASSADLARVLLWQSVHQRAPLEGAGILTVDRFRTWLWDEAERTRVAPRVCQLVARLTLSQNLVECMTVPAYELLTAQTSKRGATRRARMARPRETEIEAAPDAPEDHARREAS